MHELPPALRQRLQKVPLIWGTLTAFSLLLPLMTKLQVPTEGPIEQSKAVLPLLGGMAVMMAMSSLFLRFVLLSDNKLRLFATEKLRDLPKEEALDRIFKHWMVLNIIAWALNDSVANMGAVAARLAGTPDAAMSFGALALGLNLIMFPNFSKVLSRAGF